MMQLRSARTPWCQHIPPLRWVRGVCRAAFFAVVRRALQTDDGKAILAASLNGLLQRSGPLALAVDASPYPDLALSPAPADGGRRPIFITARFRSGSTLLWNVFRNVPGFTAYYEPLNERRWFDPATRGDRMDATHRNVSDYWTEFDGLTELGTHYREDWIRSALYMDETAWDPCLRRYIEVLIAKAPGRPVLQFNRIDFRLPWLRRHFPAARVVHLYRHPRDQWCSSLMDVNCFPKDGRVRDFARHDKFYLLMWAEDLKYHFPFLAAERVSHPYQLFYYIWKLSYLFGRNYSHHSLAFEDLVRDPDGQLRELFTALDMEVDCLARLKAIVSGPPMGKWRAYAADDWFRRHEADCEATLADWLTGLTVPPSTGPWLSHDQPYRNGACSPVR